MQGILLNSLQLTWPYHEAMGAYWRGLGRLTVIRARGMLGLDLYCLSWIILESIDTTIIKRKDQNTEIVM